ncbi:hypothetical protein PFISCL1PPCAC_7228 [Pristionchus fissidentatus]|uniref:C2H2-type domain-containing protein n=1 Tax=Pristionchus fissidentatus TaxID=1538716 RepID=A0AAV5V8G5_9BILA|nr:hypothetical protein PFISCL1PPCAC_7228 [Pristionchus fissidentatus]
MSTPLDDWKKKFERLAKIDKIGNVLLETLKAFDLLSDMPLSFSDLEYVADSINSSVSNTKKNDRKSSIAKLEENDGYSTLRDCCFGVAEVLEFAIRSLIANNLKQNLQASTDSVAEAMLAVDSAMGEEEAGAMMKIANEAVHTGQHEIMVAVKEENDSFASCLPMDVSCMLPKDEEEEELEKYDMHMMSYAGIANSTIVEEPGTSQRSVNPYHSAKPKNKLRQCAYCSKSFSKSYRLRDHERIHTGERPFKCDLCFKTFAQKSNLVTHRNKYHSDVPFYPACRNCGFELKDQRKMIKHLLTIHNEKLYKCSICSEEFDRFNDFVEHRRNSNHI